MPRNRRGKRGNGEGRRALADATRGKWEDVALKRDCKCERVGSRAMLGDGLTPTDVAAHRRIASDPWQAFGVTMRDRERRAGIVDGMTLTDRRERT